MRENARWQAVLELMEEIFEDIKPADNIINEYLRARKYIGSSDRRFITEEVWNIIRCRCKLEFEAKDVSARHLLMVYLKDKIDEVFSGEQYGPYPLSVNEQDFVKKLREKEEDVYPPYVEAECPEWLFEKIKDVSLCKSLNQKAPADFRVNMKSREAVLSNLESEGLDFSKTAYSPIGVRSDNRVNLNNCVAYKEGDIDVQDEASQIVSILCNASEDDKIIDYCCGAGGKALTMSYLLQNKGKIFVHDINWGRLEAIKDRADRLGATNIEIVKTLEDKDYTLFLIDSPCSGTGTWRRSPDAKFRLTPVQLKNLNKTQKELLDFAYDYTKEGGRIVYVTCSVLKDENEHIVDKFLKYHRDMKKVHIKEIWDKKIKQPYPCRDVFYLKMSPLTTNTDGFFVTILEKTA